MKIRLIYGEYDDGQSYLSPVAFPMSELDYWDVEPLERPANIELDPSDYQSVLLKNEEHLKAWAEVAFYKYEIYNMELEPSAITEWPMLWFTIGDSGSGEEHEFVSCFPDWELTEKSIYELGRRSFIGDRALYVYSVVPFRSLEEWREDAENRGILGEEVES